MNLERTWALFKANCRNTKIWFDNHPIFIFLVAVIVLLVAVFRMDNERTSYGQWAVVVICGFLILYAFGQMTGLGFGMSF